MTIVSHFVYYYVYYLNNLCRQKIQKLVSNYHFNNKDKFLTILALFYHWY